MFVVHVWPASIRLLRELDTKEILIGDAHLSERRKLCCSFGSDLLPGLREKAEGDCPRDVVTVNKGEYRKVVPRTDGVLRCPGPVWRRRAASLTRQPVQALNEGNIFPEVLKRETTLPRGSRKQSRGLFCSTQNRPPQSVGSMSLLRRPIAKARPLYAHAVSSRGVSAVFSLQKFAPFSKLETADTARGIRPRLWPKCPLPDSSGGT